MIIFFLIEKNLQLSRLERCCLEWKGVTLSAISPVQGWYEVGILSCSYSVTD